MALAAEAEIAMCRRWDQVFASIARDGTAEASLVQLSGFLHDYPKDPIALFHARRLRSSAEGAAA